MYINIQILPQNQKTFVSWQERDDKPRQCAEKQRHYSAGRCPSSQGYGLPSGHVWLWKLDCKKSRIAKNWCLWTVVLEKTPEIPLDIRDIKPVNLKGDQPWIFTGRTVAVAETPAFWSSDVNRWLLGKIPNDGEDQGQKEKRKSEDEMDGCHQWCNEHELGRTPGDGDAQGGLVCCSPWCGKESDSTEWLNSNNNNINMCVLCHFSCLQLLVTLWVAASQALCPWHSLSSNTGVGCNAFFQGVFSSQRTSPRPLQLLFSGRFLTTGATWETRINCRCFQSPRPVQPFVAPWTAAWQASLSLTTWWFAQVHGHCVGDVIYSSNSLTPLLLLPSIFPGIRGFSNEPSVHIRWPKHWSFSSSMSPSSEYLRLISLNIDWFDMLPVQGTFRNLLQHHSSKASISGSQSSLRSLSHNSTWPLGRP